MNLNIVYLSSTGNTERFLENCKTYALSIGLILNLTNITDFIKNPTEEKFHLFTPTRGFGQIPNIIEDILPLYKDKIISISGTGNRNWGKNFCGAVDKIKLLLSVPELIKIELAGTNKDVYSYIEALKNFNSV